MFNLFSTHCSILCAFVVEVLSLLSFVTIAHKEICIRSFYLHEVVPKLVVVDVQQNYPRHCLPPY